MHQVRFRRYSRTLLRPRRTYRGAGRLPRATGTVLAGAATLFAVRAHAQTPSPLQEWQYQSGVVLRDMFQSKVPEWQVTLGAAMSLQPLYDGARSYHVRPGPTLDVRFRDLAFLSVGEGLGVNVLRGTNYRFGVSLGYDLGRRVSENPSRLQGLGNIEPAPVPKLFFAYALSKSFPLVFRADIRRVIGGANGVIGDISLYMPLPGSSERLVMFAGPSVTLADASYMQNVFGVGMAQAARSGYPRFHANAGLKSTGFGFEATWFFTKHWLMNGDAAVSRLLGSAADSPITQEKTEGALTLSVAYQF